MVDITDPKNLKRDIEQEAYRYYEQLSGVPLARRQDGSFQSQGCLLYTSPSPRDLSTSRMPSSA